MKKTFDINLEEAAEESERDREDLATLKANLEELLKHDDAMRVPIAVRRLVDLEVDPVVIAKALIIGDRPGGLLYQLSARAPSLENDERIARAYVSAAIRDVDATTAATLMIAGAVWLATQFNIERSMLIGLVTAASSRPKLVHRFGTGALDLVDNENAGSRAWLVDAIEKAQLPSFAVLQMSRGGR